MCRRTVRLLVPILLVVGLLVGLTSRRASTEASLTPPLPTISIVLSDNLRFEPDSVVIPADTDVTITVINEGVLQHSFRVNALGVDTGVINGGDAVTVTFHAPAGTYDFYCDVPGHKEGGQVGTLTVVDVPVAEAPTVTPAGLEIPISPIGTDDGSSRARLSDDRIDDLETRVARLETAVAGTPAGGPASPVGASPVASTPVAPGDGTRESPASVGQSVTLGGVSVTLLGAEVVPPGSFYVDPPAGMVFLALDLRIENGSPAPTAYSPEQISLKDIIEGFEFTDTFITSLASSPLERGDLAPGDFVRGTVVVQVNAASTQLLVRYGIEPYGQGEQLFWAISV